MGILTAHVKTYDKRGESAMKRCVRRCLDPLPPLRHASISDKHGRPFARWGAGGTTIAVIVAAAAVVV
jgi:hypothetical protein